MAIQILAWMVSGLYFAIFPIQTIRGEHLTSEAEGLQAVDFSEMVPVWVAWNNVATELGEELEPVSISLAERDGKTWYRVAGRLGDQSLVRLVNGFTGQVAPPIEADDAVRIASRRLLDEGVLESVDWITEAGTGSEIRGRRLPLWRVAYSEPESLSLYIDPWTGEIVARRTTRWRIFDFLWMLHIMDFDDRDDFNTPLLQIAAALGFVVALSGLIFWVMTTRLFRRR